jgi:hypothetical protein
MGRSPSGGLVKLLDVDYPSEAGDPDHFEIQLAIPPVFSSLVGEWLWEETYPH